MLLALTLGAVIPVHAVPAMVRDGNSVFLVDQSAVPVSVTGTTAETVLASINVPGGLIGPDGAIRITPVISVNNNANAKTFYVKFGGAIIAGASMANMASTQVVAMMRNRGSNVSQVAYQGGTGIGPITANVLTAAIDTRIDQPVTISCTLAVSTDTCALEAYTIEIIRP